MISRWLFMKMYSLLLAFVLLSSGSIMAKPKVPKAWKPVEEAKTLGSSSALEAAYINYIIKDGKDSCRVFEAHDSLSSYYCNTCNLAGIYQEYRYYKNRAELIPNDHRAASKRDSLMGAYTQLLSQKMQAQDFTTLEGIWISDAFNDANIPYLAIKIECTPEGKIAGGLLNGCALARELEAFGNNGSGLDAGSTMLTNEDGSLQLTFGRNRFWQGQMVLAKMAIDGIIDIRACVETAIENYQEEYKEHYGHSDYSMEIQHMMVNAVSAAWVNAISEAGAYKRKVGDMIVLSMWLQPSVPDQLRVKLSYMANVLEVGLAEGSQPDIEQWWRYFRLYKIQPHHEILYRISDDLYLANAVGTEWPKFRYCGRDTIVLQDSVVSKIGAPDTVITDRYIRNGLRFSYKDNRKQLEHYYPEMFDKKNKWTNEDMVKRFALNVVFTPLIDDPVGQPLQQMPYINISYAPSRQPVMLLHGGNGQGDSIVATARYNGDIYFEQLKNGKPTGVYSRYYSDGTYVHSQSITPEGLSQGIISNSRVQNYYEGQFKGLSREGNGTATYPDGSQYSGQWKRNRRHGQGSITTAGGEFWSGTFEAGKPQSGQGTMVLKNGTIVTGTMSGGAFTGTVKVVFPDGTTYQGDASGCNALNNLEI